ncbi:hypothetical protein RDV84_14345 [Lysobacter yananisis]|uniref:Uncharacterized protein n=1 Tax=Lysobacter yananisis TaxID=1003114 RepID=A0ABY9P2I7_9GAMM|nr:hypothetical protein [Lysobacter yananisis]WMT01177.1 hypothetical protein RDV84_14345 [Lysobacter yananisis]
MLTTPDGRYIVVKGRLWRATSPHLSVAQKTQAVGDLMAARRAVAAAAGRADALREARRRVDQAKRALGERGPVWWTDGAPDYNRRAIQRSPYAAWYAATSAGEGGGEGDAPGGDGER